MITQIVRDREISKMLREVGNFDYIVDLSQDRAYVKIGVDKLWIAFSDTDRILIVKARLATMFKDGITLLVKKVVEEIENRDNNLLEPNYLAV